MSVYYLYKAGMDPAVNQGDSTNVESSSPLPRVYLTIEQKENEVEENDGQKSAVFVRPSSYLGGGARQQTSNPSLSRFSYDYPSPE